MSHIPHWCSSFNCVAVFNELVVERLGSWRSVRTVPDETARLESHDGSTVPLVCSRMCLTCCCFCCSCCYLAAIIITVIVTIINNVTPIQYEHAPLRVRCTMLCKHPPVDPVLSCLSCFRKPSVGVCQVVNNSPDPGIAWPSARFPPDL